MSQSRFLQDESQDELKRLERNSLSLSIAGTAVALMAGIAALVFKFTNPWTILPIGFAGVITILLIRSGRFIAGNWLIIGVSALATTI